MRVSRRTMSTASRTILPASSPVLARERSLGILRAVPLIAVPALCLVLVAIAARGSTFLTPTASPGHYPSWMAGPLSGLWPANVPATRTLTWLTSLLLGAMFAAWLLASWVADRVDPRWVIAALVAAQVILFLAPPLQYTDVFNYINYGRMGVVHHLNPYTTLPVQGPHHDPSYGISNWHYLRSPYGPLFTLFTYAIVPLGVAVSFWVIKLLTALCSFALFALIWRWARLLGRSPARAVAVVGLNPIVLFWGVGADHNDVLMMLLVLSGLFVLRTAGLPLPRRLRVPAAVTRVLAEEREIVAAVLLVSAVGVKSPAAIFLPLGIALAPRRRRMLAGMAASGALLGLIMLAAFGPHLGGVRAQSTLVAPESLANLLGLALGLGGETAGLHAVLVALAAGTILFAASRAWRRPAHAMDYACVCAMALVLTLGWSAPWYVLWALPFAALCAGPRWRVALAVYTVYALIASGPNFTDVERMLHFHPRSGQLGVAHLRQFEHLAAQ
jgi:Glycosyltransferase family 87